MSDLHHFGLRRWERHYPRPRTTKSNWCLTHSHGDVESPHFFYAIISVTYYAALEDPVESLVKISSPEENSISDILRAVGGRDEFESELRHIVADASSLRNGISTSLVEFKVSNAIVAKICFIDDICWAAKIRELSPYKCRASCGRRSWLKNSAQPYRLLDTRDAISINFCIVSRNG